MSRLIVTDFRGRSIRITDERLIHIRRAYPEMAGMERFIRETLEAPDATQQSNSDTDVTLYYRWFDQTTRGGRYVCVVVQSSDAFVLTACLTRRIP